METKFPKVSTIQTGNLETGNLEEVDKRILQLKQQGRSIRAIGKELGLSHTAIRKRLKRLQEKPTG
jgi:DNA-binding Lrp family transcriptional regulator